MKLQLHWMDVLKCKPPEMGKCWLLNCPLSPYSHAILYSLNFSPCPHPLLFKGNQKPVSFEFFVQVVLGECSPICSSKIISIPASSSLRDSKGQELGPCMRAVNCSHHSHPTPKKHICASCILSTFSLFHVTQRKPLYCSHSPTRHQPWDQTQVPSCIQRTREFQSDINPCKWYDLDLHL